MWLLWAEWPYHDAFETVIRYGLEYILMKPFGKELQLRRGFFLIGICVIGNRFPDGKLSAETRMLRFNIA